MGRPIDWEMVSAVHRLKGRGLTDERVAKELSTDERVIHRTSVNRWKRLELPVEKLSPSLP